MSFQVAHLDSQSVPLVRELPVADDQAFLRGALLQEVDGEWKEYLSDDYSDEQVDGIALARYGVDGTDPYVGTPSFDITGGLGILPGRMQAAVVDRGNRERLYSAEYVGALPAAVGGSYEVVRSADRKWRVNFSATASPVVRLESMTWTEDPINKNRVLVSFLGA